MGRVTRFLLGWTVLLAAGCQGMGGLPLPQPSAPPTDQQILLVPAESPTPIVLSGWPLTQAVPPGPGTPPPGQGEPSPTPEVREMPAPGLPPKVYRNPPPFPQPGDDALAQGPVYLEGASWQGKPGEGWLVLRGHLPTPCHQLRVQIQGPDAQGVIQIHLYSVADPQEACVEVLAPFELRIPFPFNLQEAQGRVVINGIPLQDLLSTPNP